MDSLLARLIPDEFSRRKLPSEFAHAFALNQVSDWLPVAQLLLVTLFNRVLADCFNLTVGLLVLCLLCVIRVHSELCIA